GLDGLGVGAEAVAAVEHRVDAAVGAVGQAARAGLEQGADAVLDAAGVAAAVDVAAGQAGIADAVAAPALGTGLGRVGLLVGRDEVRDLPSADLAEGLRRIERDFVH